jgi:hypothetical protein
MYNIQNDLKKRVKLIISGSFFSYSYDFVVFCCVGPLALPKKDKIDPWHLAMLDLHVVK